MYVRVGHCVISLCCHAWSGHVSINVYCSKLTFMHDSVDVSFPCGFPAGYRESVESYKFTDSIFVYGYTKSRMFVVETV